MKILCINIHPDFTWLTSKGLHLDVTYSTSPKQILPIIYASNLYVPDVSSLAKNYTGYDVIMVGWSPKDYGSILNNTGGYTYPDKQNNTRLISVRVDDLPINMYPLHEMMHTICNFINLDFKDFVPKDFMDTTPVNGVWFPYYLNDPNINNPNSNFNQTWRNIIPFLPRLNSIGSLPVVTLTRKTSTSKEIIGELRTADGKFGCDTLELAWKNNARNISAIPTGTYTVKKTFSFKFGNVYEIQNVPNRTAIYFHEGNYFFNSLGCILLGSLPKDINNDKITDIQNSRLIRKAFEQYMGFKDFTLKIL